MELVIVSDSAAVGRLAAERIAAVVTKKPNAVSGLATGSSPTGIYAELRRRVEAGEVTFEHARGFALDEYVGIAVDHPESYASVINRDVVVPLRFDPAAVAVPDGRANDLERAASEYEEAIAAAGGIDIQILGIGTNGPIGFNEPTSSLASRTRIKTLAPRTREDNRRFFNSIGEVPIHCMTKGLGTILDAQALLMVAQGEGKAAAVAAAVEGPLTSLVPGSALQLHRHATVILDEAAACRLQLADYYRYTYANKPLAA